MNITYTFLSAYRKCRRMAWLQYVDKVIKPEDINQRNFIVGTVADWLFSKWATTEYFAPGWMSRKAPHMFEWFASKRNIKYLNEDDKEGLKKKLEIAVTRLEDCTFSLGLDEKKLQLQRKVIFSEEGTDFFAKLDIWIPEDLHLIDLKITKDKKWLNDAQLLMYTWMLKKVNQDVSFASFLSPMMSNPVVDCDISLSRVESFEEEMWKDIELIKSDEHWEANAKDCWGCPVEKFCADADVEKEMKNMTKAEQGGFTFDLGD